ncbi:MAG: RNA chaperone ProQ [Succinivibrio sp.]
METQINNEQNAQSVQNKTENSIEGTHYDHIKETLELLYKTFPKAFIKDGELKPLKIGIFEDLKEKVSSIEGLSVSKVRAALRLYTSRLKYLYSVKEGACRIDLEGNDCGEPVTAEHVQHSQERIKEINAKRQSLKPKKQNASKKNFKKNGNGAKAPKKTFRIEGQKASSDDLKAGTEVLVLSSDKSYVRGIVATDAQKDSVIVTLKTGLSVNLSLDRVLLPTKKS